MAPLFWVVLAIPALLGAEASVQPVEHMKLCSDRCDSDCKMYDVPVGECFSPSRLFPGDAQWGDGQGQASGFGGSAGTPPWQRSKTPGPASKQADGCRSPLKIAEPRGSGHGVLSRIHSGSSASDGIGAVQ